MRELSFVGLSADGRHLLLVAPDATEFALRIDDRLATALRREGERLRGQPTDLGPMPRNPSPREIQERIRGGMSVNAIATAAGVSEESVARFASAVLAERAFIASQAAETLIRFEDSNMPLGEAVSERLGSKGIDSATVRWDAWRRADGDWTVLCAYPFDRGERIATFGYDVTARRLWPDDDEARWIIERPASEPRRTPEAAVPSAPQPSSSIDDSGHRDANSWDPNHPAARAHQRRMNSQDAPGLHSPDTLATSEGRRSEWDQLLLGETQTNPHGDHRM